MVDESVIIAAQEAVKAYLAGELLNGSPVSARACRAAQRIVLANLRELERAADAEAQRLGFKSAKAITEAFLKAHTSAGK